MARDQSDSWLALRRDRVGAHSGLLGTELVHPLRYDRAVNTQPWAAWLLWRRGECGWMEFPGEGPAYEQRSEAYFADNYRRDERSVDGAVAWARAYEPEGEAEQDGP